MSFYRVIVILFLTVSFTLYSQSIDELQALINKGKYIEAELIAKNINNNSENQKLLILKGDIYFELENYQEAKKAYEKAFDLDDNEAAFIKYGKILSVLKEYEKSEKLLKNGIDDFEKSIPIRLELASNYIRAGKLTDAEVQIKRARDINENDPCIYITEGDMYFDQRVYELSKKSYEKALSLDENQKEARSKLATSYYWLANREADQDLSNELFTMSLKEWDRVTKQDTMDASAFFNKGKILFFAKQYKDAVPALFRYYELRPDGNLGRWYLGQSLYELGLCDSAAPQLKYVSENIDSVKFKAKLLMARCYYDNKDYPNSKSAYKEILTMDKDNPEIEEADIRRYGTAELFTGDTTAALTIYKDLVNKNPDASCNLMNMVGRLMFSAKKYDEALFFFDKRLNTTSCNDSTDSKIIYYKGLSYLFMNQRDTAIVYLEKSAAMDSTDAGSFVYLGDAYAGMEDDKKAIDNFEKAIEISKAYPEINKNNIRSAYGKLSGLYYKAKEWKKLANVAISWSEEQPEIEYGFLYAAIAYQGMSDVKNACTWYKKVLKVNPDNKAAAQNRSALGCD